MQNFRDMTSRAQSIPDRVRASLLAAGIPAPKHDARSLAELFPAEFNVAATTLSVEEMARVLVYLVERKIISVPEAPDAARVRKVEPGWHFCQFYRDFGQLLDLVAPYIAEGLENGEGCLWVIPDPVSGKAARAALARHVDAVEDYIAGGQLEILSHRDWYLDAAGRLKSFEEIARALLGRQDRALEKGFKFLRAAGDTGWVSGTEESREFIDYEMKVNAALGATKVAAICTYRADVTADELVAIVSAHQDALLRESGPFRVESALP